MSAASSERESKVIAPVAFEASRCEGTASPAARVLDVRSPKFVRGGGLLREAVKSDVEVKLSAVAAQRDAAAIESARGIACITRLLQDALRARMAVAGGLGARLSVQRMVPPLPHGQGVGIRVTVTLTGRSPAGTPSVREYFESLGFVAGPAEVTLTSNAVSHPPSAASQRRLISLLYTRATAHEL